MPSNKLVAADFETLATGFNFFGGINFGGCFLAGRIDGFLNLKVFESGASPKKPYNPADDKWKFLPRSPTTQSQINEVLSKVKQTKSWYAGLFDEIANKLDGTPSDEVTILDARKSLEFVAAVYCSSRQNKNISIPIGKDNPLYNSLLPS